MGRSPAIKASFLARDHFFSWISPFLLDQVSGMTPSTRAERLDELWSIPRLYLRYAW
jgi:hypothetical protein